MIRFGETEIRKEEFYGAKKPIKVWDIDVDNIFISKFVELKTNSKYSIEYLDEAVRHVQCIRQLMMTLKPSENAKVTPALTGRRPVHPAADDGLICYVNISPYMMKIY